MTSYEYLLFCLIHWGRVEALLAYWSNALSKEEWRHWTDYPWGSFAGLHHGQHAVLGAAMVTHLRRWGPHLVRLCEYSPCFSCVSLDFPPHCCFSFIQALRWCTTKITGLINFSPLQWHSRVIPLIPTIVNIYSALSTMNYYWILHVLHLFSRGNTTKTTNEGRVRKTPWKTNWTNAQNQGTLHFLAHSVLSCNLSAFFCSSDGIFWW